MRENLQPLMDITPDAIRTLIDTGIVPAGLREMPTDDLEGALRRNAMLYACQALSRAEPPIHNKEGRAVRTLQGIMDVAQTALAANIQPQPAELQAS